MSMGERQERHEDEDEDEDDVNDTRILLVQNGLDARYSGRHSSLGARELSKIKKTRMRGHSLRVVPP